MIERVPGNGDSSPAFQYGDFDLDPRTRTLVCTYAVGDRRFEERIVIDSGSARNDGVEEAARLVFLLVGVSYYKAFAPPVIDLGDTAVVASLGPFLAEYYREGLGEFAYQNELDLRATSFVGGREVPRHDGKDGVGAVERPLVPFGGGLDSLVTVDIVRRATPDAALFVVSRAGDRFDAIETPAAETGLPVLRASRELDPAILRSRELGFLNGHVPVTGILSAIAVLVAVMNDRDAVVMSNEWSASAGNVEFDGVLVNHQYSKSLAFERSFRAVLRDLSPAFPDYFSLLRPRSELWIAREFARHPRHLQTFRSCNRAFHIDPAQRLDHWCGVCDKCAFIDLILSPFVEREVLGRIFRGNEPLENPDLLAVFETLAGLGQGAKPFECVGDVDECRAAIVLAGKRADRQGSAVLAALGEQIRASSAEPALDVEHLFSPIGEHFISEPYASDLRLA